LACAHGVTRGANIMAWAFGRSVRTIRPANTIAPVIAIVQLTTLERGQPTACTGDQAGITASDRTEWLQKHALAETAFPPAQHHAVLRQQRNLRPTTLRLDRSHKLAAHRFFRLCLSLWLLGGWSFGKCGRRETGQD